MTNSTDFRSTVSLPENWAADWELTARLGAGAYSTVYRAVRRDHPSIDAAIKIISIPATQAEADSLREEGFTADQSQSYYDDLARQYISEIELLERFKGTPNIVGIEDYKLLRKKDGIGNVIYIRMELLTALDSILRNRVLSEEETIRVGMDVCGALELCEASKIIHRDIKPANIFVNDKTPGHVFYKLGDFGIARSLQSIAGGLSTKGTPNYMAPEIFLNQPYDHRVDLYSLGITLYRLLNQNTLPLIPVGNYSAAAREKALSARLAGQPLPPPCGARPETAKVILKACAFRPEDRYFSAAAMKADLQALLNRGVPGATPVLPEEDADDRTVDLTGSQPAGSLSARSGSQAVQSSVQSVSQPAAPSSSQSGSQPAARSSMQPASRLTSPVSAQPGSQPAARTVTQAESQPAPAATSPSPAGQSSRASGRSRKKLLIPVIAVGVALIVAGLLIFTRPKPQADPKPPLPSPSAAAPVEPSVAATPEPTIEPAAAFSSDPTAAPAESTDAPTLATTPEVTQSPSPVVTEAPTPEPTEVPTPEPTEVPTPEPEAAVVSVVTGDVNQDGLTDLRDVLRLQKIIAGLTREYDPVEADCNGDGIINLQDLIRLQKWISDPKEAWTEGSQNHE